MDAFDTRMSTFGGKQKQDKEKYFDKFIAEKRGFIRTSNAYQNASPQKIVECEVVDPHRIEVQRPGPAFKQSYDNKYKRTTSFANDDGRVKIPLNVNKQKQAFLKTAERVRAMDELKNSNIKFDQDEMGSPMLNFLESQENFNKQPAEFGKGHEEYQQSLSVFQQKRSSVDPRHTDYGSGQQVAGPRAKTSQKMRDRPTKKNNKKIETDRETPAEFQTINEEGAFAKSNSYQMSPSNRQSQRPAPIEASDGPKPYEMWKQNMVVQQETVQLGQNRNIKLNYDQSSKAHLTSAKGGPNLNDYKSLSRVYHGQSLAVDKHHIDLDLGVHKVMKTTTYQIGKKGTDAPNEKTSSHQAVFTTKVHPDEEPPKIDKNSRRCDPDRISGRK